MALADVRVTMQQRRRVKRRPNARIERQASRLDHHSWHLLPHGSTVAVFGALEDG